MNMHFLPAGDTVVVVEFGDRIDRAMSDQVLQLREQIHDAAPEGLIETVPTFRSLSVHYDPNLTSGARLTETIRTLQRIRTDVRTHNRRLWRVPACFEPEFSLDIAEIAAHAGLSIDAVIARYTQIQFHVYMIGFFPGFPYMGDLPEELQLPRRTDPRIRVPAGSIAIAMGMTGIYPTDSPGGWHVIGAAPIRLFDPKWPEPALIKPGDAVRFEPIERGEFVAIGQAIANGTYVVPHREIAA
jgi:KipI family sensor histidine kinase inhibitor